MKSLLSILLCLIPFCLFSQQYTVAGKVTNANNRQPLAFVNIVVNDGQYGGMSDIDGKYEIQAQEPIRTLKFSCLGYQTMVKTLEAGADRVNVALEPASYQLDEVTVEAGENPAHRIIDSVMAHRKENHPNFLDSYSYHIYDKMVFTIDSSEMNVALGKTQESSGLQRFDSLLKSSDLMVMETYSEVLFRSPDHLRQNVLGTKMAGSKDPQVVYLASKMQSTSFYDELVNIAGTDYVNPISHNSKYHYFFTLESTTPANGNDSLYVISFHPMRGSTFSGLRGTMTIHSDGWALQSVKASPDKQGGLFEVSIQQLYQKIQGRWFPKQLNTNLVFPSVVVDVDGYAFPMIAVGKSYVTDVVLNPTLSRREFSEVELSVNRDAAYRNDAFWTQHRIDSLSQRVMNTYRLMDSLTEGSDIIDRVLDYSNALLLESAIPIGPLDLDLGRLVRISGYRGWYFGLGFTTNDRFSRYFRLGAHGGYWTKLRDFDYGLDGKVLLDRQHEMELGLSFAHKSTPVGEFTGFGGGDNALSENEYRYTFYENVMARGNYYEAFYNTRFARHFKAFVTFGIHDKNYHLAPYDTLPTQRFANLELKLRFAYGERFIGTTKGIQSQGTDYPIVWLSYQHSFKGVLGSQYEFDRYKLQIEKDFKTKYLGTTSVLLQAGYASSSCPLIETFSPIGSYEIVGLYAPGSFSTMREEEFFCDRFVSLYLIHDFQGRLWTPNSKWFRPQLSLVTNMGWGAPTMTKGYFESGVVVKGLLNISFAKIGAGVFYRYGAYSFPKVIDNFAFKYCISLDL